MSEMPAVSRNGGVIGKTTQFGWNADPNQDYNTNVLKIGMRDNPLTPHAAALTRSMQSQIGGANPGDVIETIDDNGNKRYSYFADRAPESDPRVDLYQPQGFDKSIADHQRVVNLGGGNAKLTGKALSDAGEANIAKWAQQPVQPPNVAQNPASAQNTQPSIAQSMENLQGGQNPEIHFQTGAMQTSPPNSISLPWLAPQNSLASANQNAQSAPMLSIPHSQRAIGHDFLTNFYSKHPVFAALGGF